jgi:ArsR family transcriptional regulator
MISTPSILDRMSALADGVRGRILLLLEDHEMTVSELGSVLQLPQSSTSRQLKTLAEAAWVVSRPDGTRRLYQMTPSDSENPDRQLWRLTREQLATTPAAEEDRRRLQSVLSERRDRSKQFFETDAAHWDRVRDELFGTRFFLIALLSLIDSKATVGDLGCGSGALSEVLAPVVQRIIAVDDSAAMLSEARERLGRFDHVEIQRGTLEALPLPDQTLDIATLMLVLHHLPDPEKAIAEVGRVLKPGGKLLIVDMLPHDRQEYRQSMGHVWMGFATDRIERLLNRYEFENVRIIDLPTETTAMGPSLFAATATLRQ